MDQDEDQQEYQDQVLDNAMSRNEIQGSSPGSKQLERNQSNQFTLTKTSNMNITFQDPAIKAKLMAEAKQEKEQKRLQMLQMEARIKKLQIEEEKAKKRINDARKQQQFIAQMKEEKIRKQQEKQRFLEEMAQKEEENKRKILEDRLKQKEILMKSQHDKFHTNKKISEEIKEQKTRIKQSIETGKMSYLEEKQKANVEKRDYVSNDKQFKATIKGNFIASTEKAYHEKIERQKQEALEYERKMKELEQHEQQLLSRLQKTQQMENSEFQKLRAMKQQQNGSGSKKNQIDSVNSSYQTREKDFQSIKEENGKKYKPLVLVGPSGAGKSTLTKYIMNKYKGLFEFSISSTTRAPRDGEENGVHYYFMKRPDFEQEIKTGDFLEYNEVHGNYYGTSKTDVLEVQKHGKICILDIDVKGARDVHKSGVVDCNYVLVTTPSIDELRNRLEARGTETEESLNKRVGNAEAELKMAQEIGIFQKTLINDTQDQFIKDSEAYIKKIYGIQ